MENLEQNKSIFISVTHILTQEQEEFIKSIEQYINDNGFHYFTFGRYIEKSQNASSEIREAIDNTIGTIIIAVRKIYFPHGIEYPSGSNQRNIEERYYPSVWNQIEGAMTLQAQHPLLLLYENGLFLEGIFMPSFLSSKAFSPPNLSEDVLFFLEDWLKLL